jgi:uncharacterized membrane protein
VNISAFHYFPIPAPYLAVLALCVVMLIAVIQIRAFEYAFEALGIDRRYILSLLALCLVGSYVNIPIAELPPEQVVSNRVVEFFGMRYVIPQAEVWPRTIIAVNVGGALIPTALSFYLIIKERLWLRGALAVAIVTAVVHRVAHPLPGVGIAVPNFVPALAAVGTAVVLSRPFAAPLAYVAGSLGTLIGADLLNFGKIRGLGAPVASIGGAGTFDGVFLTGILAVLIAGLPFGRQPGSVRKEEAEPPSGSA